MADDEQKLDFEDLKYNIGWFNKSINYPTIFLAVFFTIFISVVFALFSDDAFEWFASIVIISVIIIGVIAISKQQETISQAVKKFAKRNGFTYIDNHDFGPGTMFNYGHDKYMDYGVKGSLGGLPFTFFTYKYTLGNGKSSRTYDSTVMRIELPRKMPHMVIDSLVEDGNWLQSTLPIKFDKSQKIDLEGDWPTYFSLYAPDKFGVDALTILAPNVMETIMKYNSLCDTEFIDNNLYFYWPDTEISPDSWSNKFFSSYEVLRKISDKLTRPNALSKYSEAKISSSNSDPYRLKPSNDLGYIFIGAVLIALYFIFGFAWPNIRYLPDLGFLVLGIHFIYNFNKRQSAIEKLRKRVKEIPK